MTSPRFRDLADSASIKHNVTVTVNSDSDRSLALAADSASGSVTGTVASSYWWY
jgi:hypothetical protein